MRRLVAAGAALLIVLAVTLGGCGETTTSGPPGSNLSKGEKFRIAEEQLQEEGWSAGQAEKLGKLAEREGVGARGAVELGTMAKNLPGRE